jgi:hypothetical protein
MDRWLEMVSLKKKENKKQDQLHDKRKQMELATSTSTSGIKDKFQKNVKMMRAICN